MEWPSSTERNRQSAYIVIETINEAIDQGCPFPRGLLHSSRQDCEKVLPRVPYRRVQPKRATRSWVQSTVEAFFPVGFLPVEVIHTAVGCP